MLSKQEALKQIAAKMDEMDKLLKEANELAAATDLQPYDQYEGELDEDEAIADIQYRLGGWNASTC